nr:zinc knuckle CX2CX4HX4C [Tanacetum cinerariifolium]
MVARLGFVVVTVVGFVEDVEIVVVRIVVDSIVLVSYSTSYIWYQTEDIVKKRLDVEMKMLRDLKKMMNLGFEASRDDELLATCYVAVSEDPNIGRDQKMECFGGKVLSSYNSKAPFDHTKDKLTSKWATWNTNCQKFNATYKFAQRSCKSGENEMNVSWHVKKFKDEHKGRSFSQESSWEILCASPKWEAPEPITFLTVKKHQRKRRAIQRKHETTSPGRTCGNNLGVVSPCALTRKKRMLPPFGMEMRKDEGIEQCSIEVSDENCNKGKETKVNDGIVSEMKVNLENDKVEKVSDIEQVHRNQFVDDNVGNNCGNMSAENKQSKHVEIKVVLKSNTYVGVTVKNQTEYDKKLIKIPTEIDCSGNEVVVFDEVLVVEGRYRRVLVENFANTPLPNEIEVIYVNDMKQEVCRKMAKVVYDWKAPGLMDCESEIEKKDKSFAYLVIEWIKKSHP